MLPHLLVCSTAALTSAESCKGGIWQCQKKICLASAAWTGLARSQALSCSTSAQSFANIRIGLCQLKVWPKSFPHVLVSSLNLFVFFRGGISCKASDEMQKWQIGFFLDFIRQNFTFGSGTRFTLQSYKGNTKVWDRVVF